MAHLHTLKTRIPRLGFYLGNKSPMHFSIDFESIMEMDKDVCKDLASTLAISMQNLDRI
jgi:hypothetical protein